MRITIFHNVATDGYGRHVGFDGYQPGQPVVPVFAHDVELLDGGIEELQVIAELAFKTFNADPELLAGRQRDLATRYRGLLLRSLSVGDVVRAGLIPLACDPAGFRVVPADLNEVRVSQHGTRPFEGS